VQSRCSVGVALRGATVPRGAAVIRYEGARGVTWRVKYVDADGKQVMETVGRERDGVTRRDAEADLRERLVRVERKQYRRPEPVTFRQASKRWSEDVGARKQWRPATIAQYQSILGRLNDTFGAFRLTDVRPSDVSGYVTKHSAALSAASVKRLPLRDVRGRAQGRLQARRARVAGEVPSVPRPPRHVDHERRDRRGEPGRAHDEGGPREHGDDQAIPAASRRRVHGGGRGTRTSASGRQSFYPFSTHSAGPKRT
jgi:hypothetical protein